MVPCFAKPYSCSASSINSPNSGCLGCPSSTVNLRCSSPSTPTLTVTHGFSTIPLLLLLPVPEEKEQEACDLLVEEARGGKRIWGLMVVRVGERRATCWSWRWRGGKQGGRSHGVRWARWTWLFPFSSFRRRFDHADGTSSLLGLDMFVTTADTIKEPILSMANSIAISNCLYLLA
ncbi:Os09g0338701 [Oryza sativa Japonica Group]|uniref:Os09g0338701 protein n=2 Tax=Oryza sativa subsp. japonica TaxID=39947 RepID=Q6ESP0_ORYSJ|nr:hypothetical protein [Oryza sativa Japonica Group]BAT07569.1 Os09g0338701 [Oryza sativa Japonica Group]